MASEVEQHEGEKKELIRLDTDKRTFTMLQKTSTLKEVDNKSRFTTLLQNMFKPQAVLNL